jgi:hypothetical protein
MSVIQGARFLERQQFFNGQRLFASDLQGLEEFHREMRWLHNQSLHQPGVGTGYAVTGPAGASEVAIEPGYAIDANGREIILVEQAVEPVPPVAHDGFGAPVFYDLTVSYPSDSELEESETREGICLPRGVVRLEERPVFCWVRLGPPPERQPIDDTLKNEIQTGLRIRLARAEVFNCTLKSALSVTQRRNARPPTQPYVACGHESLESATFELIDDDDTENEDNGFIARMSVDTTSAGFRTRPCYFVSVTGPRVFPLPAEGPTARYLVDGITSLLIPDDRQLTRFEFEMFCFLIVGGTRGQAIEDIQKTWHVDWIGVEG